ncbi:hypothetical protein KP509_28G007700 [Ceratopteris richardii]|uniref:Tify domain-containing protein n=1 Tax=Ceratopteris richardii TaxID=49495 RepID=A0A8T2R9B5_CERRI|nr:hypothetical protein KP509_28G007700 [Ceratopteris richardii]
MPPLHGEASLHSTVSTLVLGLMMADLPYAIQSSLGPSGSHLGVDSEYIRAFHNNVALSMEDPIWIHGPGKENYPTDSDYLGSLPVLNTGAGGSCLGIDPSNCCSDRLSTQLTLFYAGTVNVFDNVTTDKVQRILSLAAGSSPPLQSMGTVSPSFHSLRKQHPSCLQQSSSFGLNVQAPYVLGFTVQDAKSKNAYDSPQVQLPEECYNHDLADFLEPCEIMVPKALPIARKASLARFLERRKKDKWQLYHNGK